MNSETEGESQSRNYLRALSEAKMAERPVPPATGLGVYAIKQKKERLKNRKLPITGKTGFAPGLQWADGILAKLW